MVVKLPTDLKFRFADFSKKFENKFDDLQRNLRFLKNQGIFPKDETMEMVRPNVTEGLYSELVEKGNDGIVIIQNGVLKFINQKMAKLTGFKTSEALNKDFSDFISPEYKNKTVEIHKKRLMGKPVPRTYDIEIMSKKGKKIPVEVNASLINLNGKTASMAIIRDITERKETENRLIEERNKLNAIYLSTQEGLALYDQRGRVVYMNPALEKLFGVRSHLIGVKRRDIIKNRGKYFQYRLERFDDSYQTQKEVYSGKRISNVLMIVHSSPPKYLEADYVPIKNSNSLVVGMSASFRDVTLLKKQAEKIERQLFEVETQRNRMQAIYDNVEDGVYIFDKKLNVSSVNSACELMIGQSSDEMIGKKYYQVFDCHNRLGHRFPEFNPVSKVLATKEAIPYDEHLHTTAQGGSRWVGASYTPILDKKGDIEQIVCVIRDITSIKELEQAKSEFVSLASHELRTPLTVIGGYLSMILNGDFGDLSKQVNRENFMFVLKKVQKETQRLTKLVEELLNVSRIEEGRLKLNQRKINPLEVINEVNEELRPLSALKGVRMDFRNNSGMFKKTPLIYADRDRFKEIMVNLVDNAIKFTESGNEITITSYIKSGRLFIEVEDDGPGISENIVPRIFEKFQQDPGSYLKENKGTGLGLFIVKSLVKMHDGDIWVDSKKGVGTKFSFYIPVVAGT